MRVPITEHKLTMDYQLVNKYLSNETSEAEVAEIFAWIEAAPENRKAFIDYKKIVALTAQGDENEDHTWKMFFEPRFRKQELFNSYRQVAKYAAMFLIVFGTGVGLQYIGWGFDKSQMVYQKETSVVSPLGQMTNIELPDGTKVMLNSGTSITYSENFSHGERQVNLSGEAYFDVAKDKKHPFVVQTSSLNFVVHGTSFNIEAYPEEKVINTTLVEGSLGVTDKSDKELMRLVPGENAHYELNTSGITRSKVDTELYTSWKEGLITFKNEKLKDIARKIERWYNVEVIIKNPKLGEEAYLGTIMKNKPVDQILEVLQLTSSLKYKIIPRPDKPTLIYWE